MALNSHNPSESSSDNGSNKARDVGPAAASGAAGLDLVSLSAGEHIKAPGKGGNAHADNIYGRVILAEAQDDSRKQQSDRHLRDIQVLAGDAAKNPLARESEALLLRAGATFAPTPKNLGSEGCTAALSTNVIEPLSQKYGWNVPYFQDSNLMIKYMEGHPKIADVYKVPINDLTNEDIKPGDIVVGVKGDGNHAMGWARVPANWNWNSQDMLAVGNTGLPEFGKPAMRLAQEYIGPKNGGDGEHNLDHSMINSRSPNNPYRIKGNTEFVVIRFKNPDGTPSADGPPPHGKRLGK